MRCCFHEGMHGRGTAICRNFQPAGQSAGGISEATSYQEPGQHTGAGARLRRILQNMMERDPRTWDAGEVGALLRGALLHV